MQKDTDNKIVVIVRDVIEQDVCISSEGGKMLYNHLVPLLRDNKHVVVSFEGITQLISAFLHPAIGELYGEFKGQEDRLASLLEVRLKSPHHQRLLDEVIETAKLRYQDPEAYEQAMAADD